MKERTLIAVVSCALYPQRRAAIRDTWATGPIPPNADLEFFRGIRGVEHYEPAEPNLHVLLSPDGYPELPMKTYALVCYALERDYTRLIKVDDDTYLKLPDAIGVLLSADCVAHRRYSPPHNDLIDYPQGGCYSLSRKAMHAVKSCPKMFTTGLEDAAVGRALHAYDIHITHSDRIKTDYRLGYPQPGNSIVAAHHCTPNVIHDIHIQTRKVYPTNERIQSR